MDSQRSLRGFRMDKQVKQVSMLRFVRQSQKPKHDLNTSSASDVDSSLQNNVDSTTNDSSGKNFLCGPFIKPLSTQKRFVVLSNKMNDTSSSSNDNKLPSNSVFLPVSSSKTAIIKGSSSTSPNRMDVLPPLPHTSKLFYVKPLSDEELNQSKSRSSVFDMSSVLKEKHQSSMNGHHNEHSDQSENSNDGSDNEIGSKYNCNKRLRIESDDDEASEGRVPKKPCLKEEEEEEDDRLPPPLQSKKFSPDMIEKLLDTYTDLYPDFDRMEVFETMEKWDYNLTEMTKDLDGQLKSRKKKKDISKMKELEAKKKARFEEREKLKKKKAAEIKKRKLVWKMKARFHEQEEDEEDEEDYFGKSKVYESDSSEEEHEEEEEEAITPARAMVINFFNEAQQMELITLPGCSKKKADVIMGCRPFENWKDLLYKLKTQKYMSTDLLNSAGSVLQMRNAISNLMKKCERISSEIKSFVSEIIEGDETGGMSEQPKLLNPAMKLKHYQLIGLNWLVLMHDQELNGVLADEMGLGKTIQAISFLAYLSERGELDNKLCLIVVPSSTLDNWAREMSIWLPSMGFLTYHGSQEERRGMRMDIMNDELDENISVILTTYSMVTSSPEDKSMFKKLPLHTIIYDEAHMLKNMTSQRYENLMKIRCTRRVLLTGTPLQNNLVELMSILIFVMPQLFEGRKEELKKVFSMFPKNDTEENRGRYERERIQQAKRIMAPFFLRRLKEDVLKDLPSKAEEVYYVPMNERQEVMYKNTVQVLSKRAEQMKEELEKMKLQDLDDLAELQDIASTSKSPKKSATTEDSSSNMLMKLRKLANHPLLVRNLFTDAKIKEMSKILKKSTHQESILDYIIEDFSVMSDFEIHQTCKSLAPISKFMLSSDIITQSGKMEKLDEMLPKMKKDGDRVLIFSQFVIVLNLLEEYMKIRGYEYRRLDGSTQVSDRQEMIDDFNEDERIFIFLLSTRAGGLGINLCTANVVILHDIDFNPYNDKQAEDRCHRVGQTRDVRVFRYISKNSIEEGMFQIATSKLKLEKDVTGKSEDHRKGDVVALLKTALRVDSQ